MISKITDALDRDRSVRQDLVLLALCLVVASGLSLTATFIADDLILVKNASDAEWSFQSLSRAFHMGLEDISDGWVPPQLAAFRLFFFRPVYMALLKADTALWGKWMPGYHVTNLILHLLVVYLVYFWAQDFKLDRRSSFMAALLFILFIPNWMTVTWISGRTEILSAVFILGSVYSMGRFFRSGRPVFYAVSFGAYIVALGSKENAAIIPVTLALAGAFLYRPEGGDFRTFIRTRLVPLIPFVLTWPFYFGLRYWALGGFPVPRGGFYYHSISDPDFARFILTKLHHAIVGMTFQLPALIVPQMIERSFPVLVFMVGLSAVIVVLFLRWQKGPLRYFFLGWFALSLVPTLPIGFNPIYYYLSSTVIGIVYISLYRKFCASPVRLHGKTARIALQFFLVVGLGLSVAAGPLVRNTGVMSRQVSSSVIEALREHPESKLVYILDAPAGCHYLVPELRLATDKFDDVKFMHLNLSSDLIIPITSRVIQLDNFRFEVYPSQGSFFTTGLEQVAFGKDILDFKPGVAVRHPNYQIEILGVAPNFERRHDNAFLTALRSHLELPGRDQVGVTGLRYLFSKPLLAKEHIFLRIVGGGAEVVKFASHREPKGDEPRPASAVTAKTAKGD